MIEIRTNNPQQFVDSINQAIREKRIVTWSVDSEGDYTLTQDQWVCKAWMTPKIEQNATNILRFGIIESKKHKLTKSIYGIFHGRFAEMLLTHFDRDIETLEISPLLKKDVDIYNPAE